MRNAIYVPARGDQVDKALSKYLCSYPEKERLKMMFIRETEGVYQFGSKKVFIKVERGDQVKIRVGGGFMHISDFLESYSQHELQNMRMREPLQRFQSKVAI